MKNGEKQEGKDDSDPDFHRAVPDLVPEAAYDQDCTALPNDYVQKEFGMTATKISE